MIIVIAGVSGVGKTTVGQELARRLGWRFLDADDFHSPANVAKMGSGLPLDDGDRAGWLESIRREIELNLRESRHAVLACSALKREYRRTLGIDAAVHFVMLEAPAAVLERRLQTRSGHFMPASLLTSQLQTLEIDPGLILIDAERPPQLIVSNILERLALPGKAEQETL